jgi:hypothetical protein
MNHGSHDEALPKQHVRFSMLEPTPYMCFSLCDVRYMCSPSVNEWANICVPSEAREASMQRRISRRC